MESFPDYQRTHPQSEQHSDHVSDSAEDAISDEDVLAPTSCAASKEREKDNRMVDQDKPAIWDEVLEEADELDYVHKDPQSISFLSVGTSKRRKSENKLRFSIRGSSSVALNLKAENPYIGHQEVSSGMATTNASKPMMAELLENIEEETEDFPSEFAHPTKKANISVAELLEDLQDRSGSVGATIPLHQHTRAKEGKPKVPTSGKKIPALLGQRNLDNEDPLEHVIGETSSEEEDIAPNHLTLMNKDVKGQTMTDLLQQAFNATNMECTAIPMRSTGAGYYGRMQQIILMEKDRHAKFLRQYNGEQGDSKGVTVQILSRSLEGKLTICRCLFMEKSNFPITSKVSTNCDMDDTSTRRTIIFSPKTCDNMDLVAGKMIRIFPPWKEVRVKEEEVILCTYFSDDGA